MIQRKELEVLRKWASATDRKPLVLRGARQVGKTTLVETFAKEFDVFLNLNLERAKLARLFDEDNTTEDLFMNICLVCGKQRAKRTLLFIDEIQNSPKAIERLRYFYEDLPEIYVITAGSLLESLIDFHISFPVGRVQYLVLRPCCFMEFLQGIGNDTWVKTIESLSVSSSLHSFVTDMFNTYTLIGGMPEVVSHFSENKDVIALNSVFETLLTSYRDDVEKYGKNNTNKQVIRHILNTGWQFAGERITLGNFGESAYKAREVGEAFRALEKTFLLELVYPATSSQIPILQEVKRAPKLLWIDTGLVNYTAHVQQELVMQNDILDAWRGKIAEHIVAQELLALDNRPSYHRDYWVRNANGVSSEVDFVIQYQNMVIPIEVKSGHNSKLKSLHLFMDQAKHDIAVRVWSQPFSVDMVNTGSGKTFRLVNLPFYFVGQIYKVLDQII